MFRDNGDTELVGMANQLLAQNEAHSVREIMPDATWMASSQKLDSPKTKVSTTQNGQK